MCRAYYTFSINIFSNTEESLKEQHDPELMELLNEVKCNNGQLKPFFNQVSDIFVTNGLYLRLLSHPNKKFKEAKRGYIRGEGIHSLIDWMNIRIDSMEGEPLVKKFQT
jgi:hypothetical protein